MPTSSRSAITSTSASATCCPTTANRSTRRRTSCSAASSIAFADAAWSSAIPCAATSHRFSSRSAARSASRGAAASCSRATPAASSTALPPKGSITRWCRAISRRRRSSIRRIRRLWRGATPRPAITKLAPSFGIPWRFNGICSAIAAESAGSSAVRIVNGGRPSSSSTSRGGCVRTPRFAGESWPGRRSSPGGSSGSG